MFDVESEPAWECPSGSVVVRLLGEPQVDGVEGLSARQVGLLGMLVSHGGRASAEFVLDHLWADQGAARSRKTLWNLQSAVRRTVGVDVLPLSPTDQPLRTTAISDVVIFEALAKRATEVSSAEAISLLSEALGLVEGAPFNHSQFEWARSIEVHEPARQMVEAAALRLTELAIDAGAIDVARKGLCQGLKALGVNEPLYRARMRVEAHNGDKASVTKVYRELCNRLGDVFDGAEPSEETKALISDLTSSVMRRVG